MRDEVYTSRGDRRQNRSRSRERDRGRRSSERNRPRIISAQNGDRHRDRRYTKRSRSRSYEKQRQRSRSPHREHRDYHRNSVQNNQHFNNTTNNKNTDNNTAYSLQRDIKEDFRISPIEFDEDIGIEDMDRGQQCDYAPGSRSNEVNEDYQNDQEEVSEAEDVRNSKSMMQPAQMLNDLKNAYSKENRISMLEGEDQELKAIQNTTETFTSKVGGKEINKKEIMQEAQQKREELQKKNRRQDANEFLASINKQREGTPRLEKPASERIISRNLTINRETKVIARRAPETRNEDLRGKLSHSAKDSTTKSILDRIVKI